MAPFLKITVKEANNNGAQRIQTSQSQFPRSGTHGQNREFRAKGHAANTQTEGSRGGEASRGSSWHANGDVKDASLGGPRRVYDRYSNTNRRPDAKGDEFLTQLRFVHFLMHLIYSNIIIYFQFEFSFHTSAQIDNDGHCCKIKFVII